MKFKDAVEMWSFFQLLIHTWYQSVTKLCHTVFATVCTCRVWSRFPEAFFRLAFTYICFAQFVLSFACLIRFGPLTEFAKLGWWCGPSFCAPCCVRHCCLGGFVSWQNDQIEMSPHKQVQVLVPQLWGAKFCSSYSVQEILWEVSEVVSLYLITEYYRDVMIWQHTYFARCTFLHW